MASDHATQGKPITCKAAVVWAPGEPFVIQEVQVDPPQKMEVRVKIIYTSICFFDILAQEGAFLLRHVPNEKQRQFPRILGHEGVGVVESVGEGIEDIEPGDHVLPLYIGECGKCFACKSGKTNMCAAEECNVYISTMSDGKSRFSVAGPDGGERVPVYHYLHTSTFAEYTVLGSPNFIKINQNTSLDKMCLFGCKFSSGVGAVWNVANVKEGSSVAIFGLGAKGLAVAEGARHRGASKIIGVDSNPEKFAKGLEMGVTFFINSEECERPVREIIMDMTDGGVDYSFDCTADVNMTREAFLSSHERWGVTVSLGYYASLGRLQLHPMELMHGRKIIGSIFGGYKGKSQLPGFIDKCLEGEIEVNLEGFITHELPFEEINQACQLLKEDKCVTCLLKF